MKLTIHAPNSNTAVPTRASIQLTVREVQELLTLVIVNPTTSIELAIEGTKHSPTKALIFDMGIAAEKPYTS